MKENSKVNNDSSMCILIDLRDKTHLLNNKSFYFHPNRLNSISLLAHDMFEVLKIQNCETEKLSFNTLSNIYKSLRPSAKCEIIIYNSNSALIENDCRIFESNAKLVGFTNFLSKPGVFSNPNNKEYSSHKITFIKPDKQTKNANIDTKELKWDVSKKINEAQSSISSMKEEVSRKHQSQPDNMTIEERNNLNMNLPNNEGSIYLLIFCSKKKAQ